MTTCPYSNPSPDTPDTAADADPSTAADTTAPPGDADQPLPIHGPEFSANPHATYARLRAQGPIAPVEIEPGVRGYLTTTYRAALYLLRNTPNKFAKNPVHWRALREGEVPADSAAAIMMGPRDSALFLDGAEHARFRQAITDSLARVDGHQLAASVGRIADGLIDAIEARGEADLVADFADPLPRQAVLEMFGCPPDLRRAITDRVHRLFDAGEDAAQLNAELEATYLELVRLKRGRPGADVISWLCAHPARLSDSEMVQHLVLLVGASTGPSTQLIANAALLLIDDERFSGDVFTGVRPVSDALDHVLWEDPPVSNYCALYARQPETYEGVELEPGVPIMVSFAAANSDPALDVAPHQRTGNRAHLAFSAGVHGCPAPDLARVISETAVEYLLDRLPGLALACPREQLVRRPGTYHSGWQSLPVTFPTSHRAHTGNPRATAATVP